MNRSNYADTAIDEIEKLWTDRKILSPPVEITVTMWGGDPENKLLFNNDDYYEMMLEVLASQDLIEENKWELINYNAADLPLPKGRKLWRSRTIQQCEIRFYLLTKLGIRFMNLVSDVRPKFDDKKNRSDI